MKIAFCCIVKPTDKEAGYLSQLLENVSPYVDGLFVTITGQNKKCSEVAKQYNARISHYDWDFNFGKARNYNFNQVPEDYTHIMWGDADDVFRGLEKLKPTIEANPDVDGFILNYLYAWDEYKNPIVVHMKTQIIKRGTAWWNELAWLHEDWTTDRDLNLKFVQGIERLHMTSSDRVEENKQRNKEISLKMVEAMPEDPRSWWNLGNSLKATGENVEAIQALEKFLELSDSDDEQYIARLRMAESYMGLRNYAKAIDQLRYAIGTKPEYPDAYHLQGHLAFEMGDYAKARDSFITGLKKKPPVFQIIVYNPRDYDFVPLMALARTYYKLNLPQLALPVLENCLKIIPNPEIQKWAKELKKEKEYAEKTLNHIAKLKNITDKKKLWQKLQEIPDEFKASPIVCNIRNLNFVKETSSGKDLVFFCAYTEEQWTPKTAEETGIGGSEEAVIHLAKRFAKKGWNVSVYNNCGYKELDFDGVKYKPYWMWNPRDKQDVVVVWRHAKPLDFNINADKVYLDLHDVYPEGELFEERIAKATKILVKSKAQRDLYSNIPDEKFLVIPNGVDLSYFEQEVERDPYLLVNFSSPDRFLDTTLDILPEVLKRLPPFIAEKVHFAWYYGWGVFDAARTSQKEQQWKAEVMAKFEELKKKGIAEGGHRINHRKVAELNLRAGALIYPSEFFEIDWIGGTKAMIAGCIPITTKFAAQGEKVGDYGLTIDSKATSKDWDKVETPNYGIRDPETKEKYIQMLVDYLKHPESYEIRRQEMSMYAKNYYDWDRIATLWHRAFTEDLEKNKDKVFSETNA